MKAKKLISQREALKMRAELNRIKEQRRRTWGKEWPEGVFIGSLEVSDVTREQVRLSRMFGRAVVVTEGDKRIYFHAVDLKDGQ